MATKARFWLARFWGARFFAALGAVLPLAPSEPAPVPTTGGTRDRRPRLDLSFPPDELEERRFQARLPRLKREDETVMRAIKDFLKGLD